jgi:hypothetical protein
MHSVIFQKAEYFKYDLLLISFTLKFVLCSWFFLERLNFSASFHTPSYYIYIYIYIHTYIYDSVYSRVVSSSGKNLKWNRLVWDIALYSLVVSCPSSHMLAEGFDIARLQSCPKLFTVATPVMSKILYVTHFDIILRTELQESIVCMWHFIANILGVQSIKTHWFFRNV